MFVVCCVVCGNGCVLCCCGSSCGVCLLCVACCVLCVLVVVCCYALFVVCCALCGVYWSVFFLRDIWLAVDVSCFLFFVWGCRVFVHYLKLLLCCGFVRGSLGQIMLCVVLVVVILRWLLVVGCCALFVVYAFVHC